MSEELKSGSKGNLPIRQNLVDTAVSFLLDPNVQQKPDDAKIAFLKKKGLTESEIDETFNRAAQTVAVSNEDRQLVNAYPLPPYQASNSFWYQLRSYSSSFVSFAVAVYVLHRFYKTYIEHWLFGSKGEKSEIVLLKQQLVELNESVSQLSSKVSSLEVSVNNQMQKVERDTLLYGVESVPRSIREILDEMGNVKSLMLNRFSFPAPPNIAGTTTGNRTQNGDSKASPKVPCIPKWQLRDSEHGKSNVDSKEESGGKEKSSVEPTIKENGLSSVEDQTQDQANNLRVAIDKLQDKVSKLAPENDVGALEDKNENSKSLDNSKENASLDGTIQDGDSETAIENQSRNAAEKTLDDDSGIESHNYLSDSESTDQTSELSERKLN